MLDWRTWLSDMMRSKRLNERASEMSDGAVNK